MIQTNRTRGNWRSKSRSVSIGVARAERCLDRAGHDAPSVGDSARRGQTLAERRHAALWLQRIARRDQQPHLIQPQPPPRDVDDMAMPGMRRIE